MKICNSMLLFCLMLVCPSSKADVMPLGRLNMGPVQLDANLDLKKISRASGTVNIKAVLVICDHYITPENNKIAQSLRVDMGTVSQVLDILEKRKIATVQKTVLQGTKATMANIVNTMKALQSGTNDIVFYYFSGHGLMEKGKTYMLTADEKYLGREEIANIMSAKSARLKMLITDACSNDIDGLSASRSISKGNQQIEAGAFDEIYRDLFLGYQGMMHLSASTEGELAWSNDQFGGFFTYHFFKEGLIKKPVNDWHKIFNDAKEKTSQMFMRMPADQRAELAQQGVKNQTAKAFSMPSAGKTGGYTNTNTTPVATGSITIYNYTGNQVNFSTDINKPGDAWIASKYKVMSVGVKNSVTLKYNAVTVGYNFQGQDYYFDLENGEFFFAYDENGILQMFYKEEGIDETNYNSVAVTDFNTLFLGHWAWDDKETGNVNITSFDKDIFVEVYGEQEEYQGGSWFTRPQEIEGTEYNFITFIYDIEGTEVTLDYAIMYDEEYPDQVQLVFVSAFTGEEQIPYEEAEQYLEASIMMYRVTE
ncbi:MAG: caspase family protein [Saprospiraceae bacterium]|nr:caspase family protein [Saprospiraceae bacterium]